MIQLGIVTEIAKLLPWGKWGLIGFIVIGLFCLLVGCGWLVFKIIGMHHKERTEWKEDAGKRSEATDKVITELTKAIKDQSQSRKRRWL